LEHLSLTLQARDNFKLVKYISFLVWLGRWSWQSDDC